MTDHSTSAVATRSAVWGNVTVATAPHTQVVDGYEYFPPDAVNWGALEPSTHTSVCPWKGTASYFDIVSEDGRLERAGWTYSTPRPAAAHIAGHVAFWRGVRVIDG